MSDNKTIRVSPEELTTETFHPKSFLEGDATKITTTDLTRIKHLRSKIRDTGRGSLTESERVEAERLGLTPRFEK